MERRPLFCWVYVIFRFGGPPGPLLAPFGLDFGGLGARFWKFLVPGFWGTSIAIHCRVLFFSGCSWEHQFVTTSNFTYFLTFFMFWFRLLVGAF